VRRLFGVSALAMTLGVAVPWGIAAAQPVNPPTAAAPPAKDTTATSTTFKAGMTVKDSAGTTVGKISKVGASADGKATVTLDVDGKAVTVPASTLSLNAMGDEVVSSKTKAQIKAEATPPG